MKRTERADPLPRLAGRAVLRRLAVSDLPAFQAYRSDPFVAQYQGWSAKSDDEATAFLTEMSAVTLFQPGTWSQIGIADAESSILIGDIGLFLGADGQHAELGITLRRASQGRGIATTAAKEAIALVFEETQAARVLGITDARNVPSARLLERIGMQRIESRAAEFRGETCIEHVYAISRQATA